MSESNNEIDDAFPGGDLAHVGKAGAPEVVEKIRSELSAKIKAKIDEFEQKGLANFPKARRVASVVSLGTNAYVPGDRVYRTTSQHSEPGKIMCVFIADEGKPRYVFQYDRPKGLLHIAPEWQLTPESHGEQPLMVGEAVGAADATRGASDLPGNHV